MIQSYAVVANGVFVGAAIDMGDKIRFRAVHPKVEDHESLWPSVTRLERAVTHLFTTGRLGAPPGPATPVPVVP